MGAVFLRQCRGHACTATRQLLFAIVSVSAVGRSRRTLDEDCRQVEEQKQLADEASRFHLGRQRQHSAVICSGALLFSSRVLCPSLITLCSHKSGRCTVELYHASHLWYPPFYTSPMFNVLLLASPDPSNTSIYRHRLCSDSCTRFHCVSS